MVSIRRTITRHGVTGYSQLCVILIGMIAGTMLIVLTDGDQELPAWWTKYIRAGFNQNFENPQISSNLDQPVMSQISSSDQSLPQYSDGLAIDAEEELASLKQFINDAVQSAVQNQVDAIKSDLDQQLADVNSQMSSVDLQSLISSQVNSQVSHQIMNNPVIDSLIIDAEDKPMKFLSDSQHFPGQARTVDPAQSYQPDHKYQPLPKYQPSPQDPDEFKSLALELLPASPVQSFSQEQITSVVDGQVTYDAANQFPEAAETDISMDSEPDYPAPMSCADNTNSLVDTGELVSFKTIPPSKCGKPFVMTEVGAGIINSYLSKPTIAQSAIPSKKPVLITAASSEYFVQVMSNIFTTSTVHQDHKIVFYDIGLSEEQIDILHRFDRSKIEYRKFIWDRLPTGLRQLKQMAWKILIIIESIGEFGGIIWFDASVALKGEYKPMINDVLMARDSCFSFTNGPSQIDAYTIVTPPIVNYIPVDKEPMRNMFGGQTHSFIAYNTEECQKSLWKPLLMCTLTRKCLDPSGAASRNCGHNCRHLFDTSILTALLNNLYRYDPDCYRLKSTEQTIIDPRASKLRLGIVAFMDKKRYHEMTDTERGYFLDHMGVRSDYDQQKFGQIMREA